MGGKGSGPKSKGIVEVLRAHVKESHRLRPKKMSEEMVARIRELRAKGYTQQAIARQLGISQCTVSVWLMSEEHRAEYYANRAEGFERWMKGKDHHLLYEKRKKRKFHLKEIGGLEFQEKKDTDFMSVIKGGTKWETEE